MVGGEVIEKFSPVSRRFLRVGVSVTIKVRRVFEIFT